MRAVVLNTKLVEAGARARLASGSRWLEWCRAMKAHLTAIGAEDDFEAVMAAAQTCAEVRSREWSVGDPDIR